MLFLRRDCGGEEDGARFPGALVVTQAVPWLQGSPSDIAAPA